MTAPRAVLRDFLRLTAAVGLSKVELRNDIAGVGITDGLEPRRVRDMLAEYSVRVVSLNVLLCFNLPERFGDAQAELRELAASAAALGCPAILLCPNSDPADRRTREEAFADTVQALAALEPILLDQGLLGYIEPLGFPESSLRSLLDAQRAIRESGCRCYRIVYDTFHHHLGPDDASTVEKEYKVALTGLVHVSGVARRSNREVYRDSHRILPDGRDHLGSLEQVRRLLRLGYPGDFSLEAFSPAVQMLGASALRDALQASIEYLTGPA
jgi:2-keto-myo-inositol isomerase